MTLDPTEAIKSTSQALKDNGLAVVLSSILVVVLIYFSYMMIDQQNKQQEVWQQINEKNVDQLRTELTVEREFVRGKLIETIDGQRAATVQHTEVIKELTNEIKRTRK